jgi:uncharacterized protein YukE
MTFCLDARPEALDRAAVAWRVVGDGVRALSGRVDAAGAELLRTWEGDAAARYAAVHAGHRAVLDGLSTVSSEVATRLDDAAAVLRSAQLRLDDLAAAVETAAEPGRFRLRGVAPDLLRRAEAEAAQVRAGADAALAPLAEAVARAARQLEDLRRAVPPADSAPYLPVRAAAHPAVILDGDRVVVSATGGGDTIRISVDPVTGTRLIDINGHVTPVLAGLDLVVRAGRGNDNVVVAQGSRVRVTLVGGAGNDTLIGSAGDETLLGSWGRDRILGRGGADRLRGGADADYLEGGGGSDMMDGGAGSDVLYGLDGDDTLRGGAGTDYVDGGRGGDRLAGGDGDDMLFGGVGVDRLAGGDGNDALYGGGGADRVLGGGGVDRAFVTPGAVVGDVASSVTVELSTVGGDIRVEGTPEFVARVQSDLDALRASPRGQEMLAALDAHGGGGTLVISEFHGDNGAFLGGSARPTVLYNPSWSIATPGTGVLAPPVVVLYHELAHAYDAHYDTGVDGTYGGADNPGVPNREREAVGLPVDADHDPATPLTLAPGHPYGLTENGLRDEFGLPRRPRY